MEKWFRKEFPDLLETKVGYLGGTTKNPSYEDVCTGRTGHAEVLQVLYDPAKTRYRDLLTFFFRIHDPTTLNRQGGDIGTQYRSAIFYHNEEQAREAKEVKEEMQKSGKFSAPIVTEISAASDFYPAESYHQGYLDKNPGGYCNHRPRW
jgi:methionine-S-sulfoxide reductase